MIELTNVSFSYGKEHSLKEISLSVKKGEVILLTGPSGCGKTTVLRLINGLIPEYYSGTLEGSVQIAGRDSADISLVERACMVGTVFQDPRAQFFSVDTTNELAFGCENQGMEEEQIYQRIDETTARFSMEELMDRNIFQLSGGEKQKIACASIDVEGPPVILMDEPASNLDSQAIDTLKEVITVWKRQGKTIVISEHRINYLWELVDRMYVLHDGRIVQSYDKKAMEALKDEDLSSMGLRSRRMDIRTKDGTNPDAEGLPTETICLQNLSMKRGKKTIFQIPRMDLSVGRVTAITGHNGRGKTTLLRCLAGLEKGWKGKIYIDGKACHPKTLRKQAYLVMQDVNHQLFTESVLEEVLISDEEENRSKDLEILRRLGLEAEADRHPMSLSGGQKQRVAVACAIASGRSLLLFDEPTSGLDYANMYELAGQFRKLCEQGKTVVIVTHDSELIRICCDQVIAL